MARAVERVVDESHIRISGENMWSDKLLGAILERRYSNAWPEKFKAGFEALFGSDGGRYPDSAKRQVTLRAPRLLKKARESYHLPRSFIRAIPVRDPTVEPRLPFFRAMTRLVLISLVVGTNGLAPDEGNFGATGTRARQRQFAHG